MRITTTKSLLQEALAPVTRVCSTHTSLPVLKHVLWTVNGKGLELAGTDLAIGLRRLVPGATAEGAGVFTLPAKAALELLAALPAGELTIEPDPGKKTVTIRSGKSEYRLHSLDAEDYPSLPEIGEGGGNLTLPAERFHQVVGFTGPFASKDETRPILTGVCFDQKADGLNVVSTDTHRMAFSVMDEFGCPEEAGLGSFIVPATAIQEAAAALPTDETPVDLRWDRNQFSVEWPGGTFVSRLIDGQFPRYERVIPSSFGREWTFDREELIAAVRRARLIARESVPANQILLALDGGTVVITAEAGEMGAAREVVAILDGAEQSPPVADIAFNASYLLDALAACKSPTVALATSEPLSPARIRASGDGAPSGWLVIVMPMQVK